VVIEAIFDVLLSSNNNLRVLGGGRKVDDLEVN